MPYMRTKTTPAPFLGSSSEPSDTGNGIAEANHLGNETLQMGDSDA